MQWSAHVDWITTTWQAGSLEMDAQLVERMAQFVWSITGRGAADVPILRWAWQGYIGWQIGGLYLGERLDGTILRVSSGLAGEYWARGYPTGHNVSRLDIAVDVWADIEPDDLIARHNVETLRARGAVSSRPWRVACVKGYGDGDTLYIGARSSEVFGRIYNKERESSTDEQYKGCTRYEVEFKAETARTVVDRCGSRRYDKRSLAEEVHSVFLRRGVGFLSDVTQARAIDTIVRGPTTSDERKLVWLQHQVAPTVKHLTAVYGRDTIFAALGIEPSTHA